MAAASCYNHGVVKLRNVAVAVLILLLLAAVFCLIPLCELSGSNVVTVARDRLAMPPRPKVARVRLPDEVLQFMNRVRDWDAQHRRDSESKLTVTWEEITATKAPKELEQKALAFIESDDVSPEIKLYLLWWLQRCTEYDLNERALSQFMKPEFHGNLKDRAHCLLLVDVLSVELLTDNITEVMGRKDSPYSRDFVVRMFDTEVELLKRAAEIPPRDAFSRLLDLQAIYKVADLEKEKDIWLFSTDEEREELSRMFRPYVEKFLDADSGWLVAEPRWFSYLLSDDRSGDRDIYRLLSGDTLTTFGSVVSITASDASKRGDWKRVLVIIDGIQHLSDLCPKDEVLLDQGMAFRLVLSAVQERSGSTDQDAELKGLNEEWDQAVSEFFRRAFAGVKFTEEGIEDSRFIGEAAKIEQQDRKIYIRQAGKKLGELILRFMELVEEMAVSSASEGT